jgi:hypothetical protein
MSACDGMVTSRAVPIDPISGILDAFRSHHIVALGEGAHGNEQGHAFRLALIRDPRFALTVNDIVVEFGSARYQNLMDQFVGGSDVPYSDFRRAWQDATPENPLWDLPIYEEFFRAVRAVNASLPNERQLRVLLGDPPVDWDQVRTHEDLLPWKRRRDLHPADLIWKEVRSKGRRALVIYGDGHFRRHNEWVQDRIGNLPPTLTGLIERGGSKVFSIWTNTTVEMERIQPDVRSWPVPSLTILRGTRLGTVNFMAFAGLKSSKRMEDQYDAVLYLGPVSSITMAEISPSLCADAAYMKMRLGRLALLPPGPEGDQVERFKDLCAARQR